MPRTEVMLVRHSESVWNLEGRFQGHRDSPLTEVGIGQARAIAQRLSCLPFSLLYTSDLGRAHTTAKIIGEVCSCRIVVDKRLRERNLGIFEGLRREELNNVHPEEYRAYKTSGPDYRIPNGESARQRFVRIVQCLEEIAERHRGETIVVVSHGGVLESLFRHALGIPLEAERRFKLLNCSMNIFFWESSRWSLRTWGDVAHLQSLRVLDDIYDLPEGTL